MKKSLAVLLLLTLVMGCGDSEQGETPPEKGAHAKTPDVVNTKSLGMTFKEIPAGTFLMGSPETEPDRHLDEHQHKVTISKAFYMQTTEVTQGQWKAVMGTEPWKGKPGGAKKAPTTQRRT